MSNRAIIVLFLVCAAGIVAATVYAAVRAPEFIFDHGGWHDGCDLESTIAPLDAPAEAWSASQDGSRWQAVRTLTFRADVGDALALVGCTDTGALEVVAGTGPGAVIVAKVTGHATTEQAARDVAAQLTPEVRGDARHLEAWHPRGPIRYTHGVGATMAFRFEVPASTAVDAELSADTGSITIQGVRLNGLAAHADTGKVRLEPASAAGDLRATTDTGSIEARLGVLDDARLDMGTDTGSIRIQVPGDARHGYEISAATDVGAISFRLPDLDEQRSARGQHSATTRGFATREVQVQMELSTDTGGITVEALA